MAVAVDDLIDPLKRAINPPGQDLYASTQDPEWIGRLEDALFEAQLAGMLAGFTVNDNDEIVPVSGTTDMARDLQQLVVLYAGFRITIIEFRNLKSTVRSKAGPVEFEVQRSAQLLQAVLKELKEQINLALTRLSDVGMVNVGVFDAVIERTYDTWYSEHVGYSGPWWVR